MDSISEVLVVSDSGNEETNCFIYDIKTGAFLARFKEGTSVRNGLALIAEDYLISAFRDDAVIKVWTLCKNNQEDFSMICPSLISALAVSNCGRYCIAGVEKSICIWEVPSGTLLLSLQYHSQTVTCLRFTSDGSHFISGGKDGMVLVWFLSDVITVAENSESFRPRYTWMDHAAEVTDIFVGSLSIYARVVTTSRDMTCRIYELETGLLLTTIRVDFAITAVTMDASEYFLVLGSAEGDIYRINLFSVVKPDVSFGEYEKKYAFLGHTNEITSLSISTTGRYLASGSDDKECRIWDMTNFSCVRKLPFAGPITNAFIIPCPPGLKDEETKFIPRLMVSQFKRQYDGADIADVETIIPTRIQQNKLSLLHMASPDEYFDQRILNSSKESIEAMVQGNFAKQDIAHCNVFMYSYALGDLFSNIPDTEEPKTEQSKSND